MASLSELYTLNFQPLYLPQLISYPDQHCDKKKVKVKEQVKSASNRKRAHCIRWKVTSMTRLRATISLSNSNRTVLVKENKYVFCYVVIDFFNNLLQIMFLI